MNKAIRALGLLYLLYLALSVLVVLPALNTLPAWFVQNTFGRQLHTEIVLFNPFTLAVEARNASLPEIDGTPFASLKRAEVNLSVSSLWHRGWVFDEAALEDIRLHIKRTGPERFNFSEMLEAIPPSPPAEQPQDEPLPGLTIHDLALSADRITLTDEARETPFSTHYDGLAIRVSDLSTVIEEGRPYRIEAQAERGGSLKWEGWVSVPAATSSGSLELSKLSLGPIWRFAEPWLNFKLPSGHLNVKGDYEIHWGEELRYSLSDASVELAELQLLPRDGLELPDTSLALTSLGLSGISLDGATRSASAGKLSINGLAVSGWSEAESVSLQEMLTPRGMPESDAGTAPPENDNSADWSASLADIALVDARIDWRSEYTDPPQLEVRPINARLSQLNWPLSGNSPLSLDLTVNNEAKLSVAGALALGPGEGTLSYRMENLHLPWFNPNLPAALKATLSDGDIQVEGETALVAFLPTTISMDGSVSNFSGLIEGSEDAITRWDSVRWDELEVDLDQHTVSLKRLLINKYSGRVHIAKDGSVNAQNVWQEEVGEQAEELVEDLDLDQAWQFLVPEIFITDSDIDFMDESLPIPFRTVIGELNGEILNISSAVDATASVNMKGSVDGYAPVTLNGTATPFGEPPALDLKLVFNGVDLSLLTPYSGTYAGYAIERGLLNLDLAYSLADNHLQGANEVLINQLKLGEKVDSDKSLNLPLELALALLTDINGVIDLSVPVSGDLDNPEFGLGSVIAGAFINLITKAVTAPFSLLAGLVSSEEDLQRLTFASGSAELSDSTRTKLDQLQEALAQRPGLTLIILGRLNLEADRKALQQQALREQLLADGLSQKQLDGKDKAYIAAIEARYRSLGETSGAELPGLIQQYDSVAGSIPIDNIQLQELAQARSVAIKQYLVTQAGMHSDRAAIEKVDLDDEAHLFSGVELDLGS